MSSEHDVMECEQAREALLDEQHGRLTPEQERALRAHLESCAACHKLADQERWLSDLLRTKLTHPSAPRTLHERVAAQLTAAVEPLPLSVVAASAPVSRPRMFWQKPGFSMALAAVALLMAAGPWLLPQHGGGPDPLVREALNDHLRVVYAERPVEVERGIHQVKPWFTGRIDFAPDIAFSGDDDFPLVGGAIGYFIDRKAATFVFKRRLHTITCFVFRAQGLPWPSNARPDDVRATTLDGFHVLMWRENDLGHALVSDVSEPELQKLRERLKLAN
jgi:anti-sigma factor (TIGR02949 family)